MKIIKSLFKFLLTVAIIGGVGYFGYRYYQKKKAATRRSKKGRWSSTCWSPAA